MTGNGTTARRVQDGPLAEISGLTVGPVSGGPPVLHDACLSVAPGQVLGVVGRSGSGKSSLAHSLLGHVRPGLEVRSGTVRVAQLDPFAPADAGRLRGRVVSFLGQDPASSLNPALQIGTQIAEAVRLRSAVRRVSEVRARVEELLLSVRLPADRAFRRRVPWQLSGGQAQRVGLALALAGTPRLLVLDEPTSGLDTVLADAVRGLLAEALCDGDRAALLVSHDPAWIASVADEVIRLEGGRTVTAGPAKRPVPVLPRARSRTAGPGARRPQDVTAAGGLHVRGLHAAHGRVAVLHDVSLTVPAGSCTAVVGPSGSGKTTLARCLAGLHLPARGSARWRETGAERGRGTAVQLVAQDARGALNPRESVRTALLRPLRGIGRRPADDALEEAVRLLGLVGLEEAVLTRRPGELSGGQRQRVALARTLAAQPRALVCDEITSALDPDTASGILDLLDSLRSTTGLTVVMVTHDLTAVARRAERVVVLDGGRVVEDGPVERVLVTPEHPRTRELLAHAGDPLLAVPE
ncbi:MULTISPECIES: ABC transporter ATP-binding protein [Streptomyces]|uniref:ATP-binding cassette domain-containing protein n=2 Tax=Streptomyces TaxID=1883 RepID=A0ABU2RQU5_9ACTN|nr:MULTISPECIES: ATP-binding cassette domain-containing protein [unclassified Streptomyces]MBK3591179.1 ABC transporter ATP-binding protein [Streptomyces sp. MBT51]MDT0429928.1 ATP-binding cassette domain-containing protein [Streptomyces sp. DSM 41770]HBF82198.1 ABC transporter ATP-binding protein [Streptomyces sp.]